MYGKILIAMVILPLWGCSAAEDGKGMAAMSMDFTWVDNQKCYDEVSPEIVLKGIPGNTTALKVSMMDIDNKHEHGGGTFAYAGGSRIPQGALKKYRAPCPNYGAPRYEFEVKAVDEGGNVLAVAKKIKKYPLQSD